MSILPIHHTFAPLADRRHVRTALRLLASPRRRRGTRNIDALRTDLERTFNASCALFASGREALLALLASCAFPEDSEVIVQGYTCVVVPNAVQAAGCVPVYADIDPETLNLDPAAVKAAITPRTKAVICQHTFGIPADMVQLKALCAEHGLMLIEDCAHMLPDDAGPPDIGTVGHAAILSFGRDKAITGVGGGAALVRDPACAAVLKKQEETAAALPASAIRRLLLYPLLYAMAKPLWRIGVGKAMLATAARTGLLPPVLTGDEKRGRMPVTLHRIPEPCAALAHEQWTRLRALNDHRRALVRFWLEASAEHGWPVLRGIDPALPLQKYPLFVPQADAVRDALKAHAIHLDDGWTGCIVCPRTVNDAAAGYERGKDPQAERICTRILSLPTHPTMTRKQAEQLTTRLIPLLRYDTPA